MASKIKINLDTSKEFFLDSKCKQNDDLTLEANIYENGLAKDLTNCSISIQALKADKTYIIQNTDIAKEKNKFIANLVKDFTRVAGKTEIEVVLTESSKQNTTFSFCLNVVGSVIKGAVESSNTVTILEDLQEKTEEARVVKAETEQLIETGGAATKGDIDKVNSSLEQKAPISYVDTKIGNMGNTKTFKGSCLYSDLPVSGAKVDDYWYVTDKSTNYCWNGTAWIDIGNNLNIGKGTITPEKTSFTIPISDVNFSMLYKTIVWLAKGQMYSTSTGVLTTSQYTTNYVPSEKIDCIPEYEFTVGTKDGQVLFWNNETYLGFIDIGQKGARFKALVGANKMAFNVSSESNKYNSVYRNTQTESEYNIGIEKLILQENNFSNNILSNLINGDTFIKYPYLTSKDDLNNLLTSGRYFSINATNQPKSGSFMIDVLEFKTTKENPKWVLQILIENNANIIYIRQIYNNIIGDFKKVQFETNTLRKVVNFGDSIFGNTNDNTSISAYLSQLLGTDCFNAGFGGCRMAERTDLQWNAFGMTALADAICSGDWSIQDQYVNDSSLPSYFKGKLTLLKQINFANDVDIITIAYATNDYVSTLTFDNPNNKYDRTTFLGALRYSVKKIQETYPHIKILVITPIWRGFVGQSYDSDTKDFGTGTLVKYYEEMEKVCKEIKVPILNSYCESGINSFTKNYFFNADDYTHPISVGRKRYAEIIAGKIKSM